MLTIRQSKFGKSRLVPLHSSAVQAACWLWVAWAFHLQRYAALPGTNAGPRFIGLQTHTGKVAFRNLQIKAL